MNADYITVISHYKGSVSIENAYGGSQHPIKSCLMRQSAQEHVLKIDFYDYFCTINLNTLKGDYRHETRHWYRRGVQNSSGHIDEVAFDGETVKGTWTEKNLDYRLIVRMEKTREFEEDL